MVELTGRARAANAVSLCASAINLGLMITALSNVWKELQLGLADGSTVVAIQADMQSVDVVWDGIKHLPSGEYSWDDFSDVLCDTEQTDTNWSNACIDSSAAWTMLLVGHYVLIVACCLQFVQMLLGITVWQCGCGRSNDRAQRITGWTAAIVGKAPAVFCFFSLFASMSTFDGAFQSVGDTVDNTTSVYVADQSGFNALIAAIIFAILAVVFNVLIVSFEFFGIIKPFRFTEMNRVNNSLNPVQAVAPGVQPAIAVATYAPPLQGQQQQQQPPPYAQQVPPPYPQQQPPPYAQQQPPPYPLQPPPYAQPAQRKV